MLNGSIIDVAIGLVLVFLVASLLASAVVEAIGGFLHRRQKHLWDSLDLLLGNTSVVDDPNLSIVDQIYRQPFITGLVRPTDRAKFKPEEQPTTKAPWRGQPKSKTRATDSQLRRRYYGPARIEAREFANSLLAFVRTGGKGDQLLKAVNLALELAQAGQPHVDGATITAVVTNLEDAASGLAGLDIASAVGKLKAAAAAGGVASEQLQAAVKEIEQAVGAFLTGEATPDQFGRMLQQLPLDLRVKLTSVAVGAGTDLVRLRAGVEEWFDRNMAAASEWYRKQTRWFLFLAGVGLAISMNIDVVHATATLYRDDAARAAVVGIAEQVGDISCPAATTDATTSTTATTATTTTATTTTTSPAADEAQRPIDLQCVKDQVGSSISLPIGWTGVDHDPWAWFVRILGWLIVGGAVTLGAPFWFDLLRRALDLRPKKAGAQ
ncbi:MAG: hypothetical protein Q7V88_16575 [Actinomycetota bacterium]|nr:hypothetical protein [Actinomycetota bacterium]